MFPVLVTNLLSEANQVQSVCREVKLEGTSEGRLSNSVLRAGLISGVGVSVCCLGGSSGV